MADIDYGQIQRSVQDATNNLRSDIQRIVNDVNEIKNRTNNDQEIDNDVREMHMRLERIEQAMQREDPRNDIMLKRISDDLADLKARFANVEKFALQFSEYLQVKFEAEKEDREYRSAA